ncbi:MAG TPA: DUF6056 family protein [Bacteroidia bacterium]|jgi:hypothetical protein|nr:DUF6056 family protein [Bacteroidia bacterium]
MADNGYSIKLNSIHVVLLLSVNFAFITLLLLLGYYNQFASDDYGLIYVKDTYGMWGGAKYMYFNWSTIWTNFLLAFPLIQFLQSTGSLFWYTLILISLLLFSVYKIVSFVFSSFDITTSTFTLLNFTVLFCATFFFLSFNKGESWFWITCSVEYLFSIVVLLLGICAILNKSVSILNYVIIALLFIFVGSCVLPLVLAAYVGFICYYCFIFSKNNWGVKKYLVKKISFAFVYFVISSVVMFFGPGKEKRMETLANPEISTGLLMGIKSIGKMALYDMPYVFPFFILFAILWGFLGNCLKNSGGQVLRRGGLKKVLFFAGCLFVLLGLVTVFPASYVLSDTPPYRALTQLYFGLTVICCAGGFVIGNHFNFSKKFSSILFIFSSFLLLFFIGKTVYQQFNIASKYSAAIDKRIELLNNLNCNGNKKLVVLEKLPPSGMLYSAEISTDSLHYNNVNLKKGLKLIFNVRLEEK